MQGLVRSIGVSNFSVKKLRDILSYAEIAPAVSQVPSKTCLLSCSIRYFGKLEGLMHCCNLHIVHVNICVLLCLWQQYMSSVNSIMPAETVPVINASAFACTSVLASACTCHSVQKHILNASQALITHEWLVTAVASCRLSATHTSETKTCCSGASQSRSM